MIIANWLILLLAISLVQLLILCLYLWNKDSPHQEPPIYGPNDPGPDWPMIVPDYEDAHNSRPGPLA